MEHKRQTHNNCLAYALWQVGVVDESAVREYETDKLEGEWEKIGSWLKRYAPGLLNLKDTITVNNFNAITGTWNLTGKGIIIVRTVFSAHCISYEEGLILNPDGPEEYMTLEEYLRRYPEYKVAKVIPVEDI